MQIPLLSTLAWLTATLFYAYQYVLRTMPNVIHDDLIEYLSTDDLGFAEFNSSYYLCYSLAQIPVGISLYKLGPRKTMSAGIILVILGLLPLIYSRDWSMIIFGRCLVAIGSATAILGTVEISRLSFDKKILQWFLGATLMIGILGAICGEVPLRFFYDRYGFASLIHTLIYTAIFLLFFILTLSPKKSNSSIENLSKHLVEIILDKNLLLFCITSALLIGPLECFGSSWAAYFLKNNYKISIEESGSISSLIYVGFAIGCPIVSFFSNSKESSMSILFLSGIGMAITISLLVSAIIPFYLLPVLFLLIGIFSAYQVSSLYVISVLTSKDKASIATSFQNSVMMFFSFLYQILVGYIITTYQAEATAVAYQYGIMSIALGCILSSLIIVTMR